MQLKKHQIEKVGQAAPILREYGIFCGWFEPRVGKTLFSLELARTQGAKNVLFVTKKNATHSVKKDVKLFHPGYKIHVINYESLHKVDFEPDVVIADECHVLGTFPKFNMKASRLKSLGRNAKFIYLSATPTPENFASLHPVFATSPVNPFQQFETAKKTGFIQWAKEYVTIIQKNYTNFPTNDYSGNYGDIKKIFPDVKHLFLSMTQAEAGMLKPINDIVLEVDTKMGEILNRFKQDRVLVSKIDGRTALGDTAAKYADKRHQLSSGTVICEDGTAKILDYSKANFIRDRFAGQKIVIFYKYVAEGELLKKIFPNWCNTEQEFTEKKEAIFIGQFISCREGMNLMSADAIVMYNIDYAALSYIQARSRFQNILRKQDCNVYWVFSKCGDEKKVWNKVKAKQKFTDFWYQKDKQLNLMK